MGKRIPANGGLCGVDVFPFSRGSAESKDPDEEESDDPQEHRNDVDAPGPVKKGGWQLALYKRSLSLAFASLFIVSFVGHTISGAKEYAVDRLAHGEAAVSVWQFAGSAQFWFESLQNWQSVFSGAFHCRAFDLVASAGLARVQTGSCATSPDRRLT